MTSGPPPYIVCSHCRGGFNIDPECIKGKYVQHISENKTITALSTDIAAFDKIMEKDNWSIKTEFIVDK